MSLLSTISNLRIGETVSFRRDEHRIYARISNDEGDVRDLFVKKGKRLGTFPVLELGTDKMLERIREDYDHRHKKGIE